MRRVADLKEEKEMTRYVKAAVDVDDLIFQDCWLISDR